MSCTRMPALTDIPVPICVKQDVMQQPLMQRQLYISALEELGSAVAAATGAANAAVIAAHAAATSGAESERRQAAADAAMRELLVRL